MIIRHKISSRLINARQLFSSTMPTRNRAELSPTLASCNSQEGDVPVMVPYSPLIDTCTETLSRNKGVSYVVDSTLSQLQIQTESLYLFLTHMKTTLLLHS
jgi:hypothetical protein